MKNKRFSLLSPLFLGIFVIVLAVIFFLLNLSVLPGVGFLLSLLALLVGVILLIKGTRASKASGTRS